MSAASDRRSVAVRIAGHEYKIRSDGDEEGLVRIAGYVDRAMDRVRERTGTVDSLDVAVLTCLNLAREILAHHEQRTSTRDDDKLRALIDRVESVLAVRSVGADSAGAKSATSTTAPVDSRPSQTSQPSQQRTLELPSVESLRDRIPVAASIDAVDLDELPSPARFAAGGRERLG
jgi:cell division protein ZapA (FtsZ GTPase activity inhibitor)